MSTLAVTIHPLTPLKGEKRREEFIGDTPSVTS
jgi:hypothetical protein